ncbi:hypothetical protein LJR267_010015 [Paraburkholderia hospita]|uniref:hypothetical protein n=1 Tax=Paraburkholderia hospita TaxID=169430 RepID=UPI003ECFB0DB
MDLPKLQCAFGFDEIETQTDESGFFFICRDCDYRNMLVNVGPDAVGRLQLVQRGDDRCPERDSP